jgi:hypothetical protein
VTNDGFFLIWIAVSAGETPLWFLVDTHAAGASIELATLYVEPCTAVRVHYAMSTTTERPGVRVDAQTPETATFFKLP